MGPWAARLRRQRVKNAMVIVRLDAPCMSVSLPSFGLRYDAAETAVKGAKLGFATSHEEDTSQLKFLRRLEPWSSPLRRGNARESGGNSLRTHLFFRRRTGEIRGVAMLTVS